VLAAPATPIARACRTPAAPRTGFAGCLLVVVCAHWALFSWPALQATAVVTASAPGGVRSVQVRHIAAAAPRAADPAPSPEPQIRKASGDARRIRAREGSGPQPMPSTLPPPDTVEQSAAEVEALMQSIAAQSAIDAEADEISVSLATVFVLNSIALFVFPIIGHAIGLSQSQFGVWSAIAIHDTSSVVGAAGTYGSEALTIATTVKLARALWIAPVALLFAYLYRQKEGGRSTKIAIPWFIFLFLAATAVRSYAPSQIFPSVFDSIVNLAKAGMIVTLFLIGASLSRGTLRKVGAKPLIQGVFLWIVITAVSLFAVLRIL